MFPTCKVRAVTAGSASRRLTICMLSCSVLELFPGLLSLVGISLARGRIKTALAEQRAIRTLPSLSDLATLPKRRCFTLSTRGALALLSCRLAETDSALQG